MIRVEAVLFDLGGTVLEIRHDDVAAILARHGASPPEGWVPAAERRGRARMEAALRAGRSRGDVWREFFEGVMDAAAAPAGMRDAAFAEIERFHREQHLWSRELRGMGDAARELRERGYRTAVISNSDGRAPQLLGRLGLLERFEFVIDSHDVGVEKPEARIFHLACERLGLLPAQCAYVGDVLAFDADAARAAGLVPVLFDAYGSYEAPPAGGMRVTTPDELLALFPARARGAA